MLPIGPDGVPAFDTLSPSPISNPAGAGISAYQYALDLQGLSSQIKCEYAPSSPISFTEPLEGLFQASGTCPPGHEVLPSRTRYLSILSNHTLGFWACGQGDRDPDGHFKSYLLYLRGYLHYDRNIGNITCTLSHVQHASVPRGILQRIWRIHYSECHATLHTFSQWSHQAIRPRFRIYRTRGSRICG